MCSKWCVHIRQRERRTRRNADSLVYLERASNSFSIWKFHHLCRLYIMHFIHSYLEWIELVTALRQTTYRQSYTHIRFFFVRWILCRWFHHRHHQRLWWLPVYFWAFLSYARVCVYVRVFVVYEWERTVYRRVRFFTILIIHSRNSIFNESEITLAKRRRRRKKVYTPILYRNKIDHMHTH